MQSSVSTPLADGADQTAEAMKGLTTREALRTLAEVGPNEPAPARHFAGAAQILRFLVNPLV